MGGHAGCPLLRQKCPPICSGRPDRVPHYSVPLPRWRGEFPESVPTLATRGAPFGGGRYAGVRPESHAISRIARFQTISFCLDCKFGVNSSPSEISVPRFRKACPRGDRVVSERGPGQTPRGCPRGDRAQSPAGSGSEARVPAGTAPRSGVPAGTETAECPRGDRGKAPAVARHYKVSPRGQEAGCLHMKTLRGCRRNR